jgi:hypothetical protein
LIIAATGCTLVKHRRGKLGTQLNKRPSISAARSVGLTANPVAAPNQHILPLLALFAAAEPAGRLRDRCI